jgi:ATP-dependent DNA helicase 2 subunit 2
MTINVERYPRTSIATPPSATSWFIKQANGGEGSAPSTHTMIGERSNEEALGGVKNQRVYQVDKEGEVGIKLDVPQSELEKGYEYGRTAVHMSETDAAETQFDTEPCLDIIGFIPEEKVS